MDGINPLYNDLSATIKDLSRRIGALERARQPYIGDWIDLNPSEVVVVNGSIDLYLTIAEFAPDTRFSEGDVFRVKQNGSGTFKYFIVSDVDTTAPGNVFLYGGDAGTLVNGAVDEIAYSKLGNQATGFPASITQTNFPLVLQGAATINTTNTISQVATVNGNMVLVEGTVDIITSGTTNYIRVPLPVQNTTVSQNGIQATRRPLRYARNLFASKDCDITISAGGVGVRGYAEIFHRDSTAMGTNIVLEYAYIYRLSS